jgi:hypothetical protein
MDAAVQEAKLLRQVNALIVAHLRDQNLTQAAAAVAAATMTPLSAATSLPNHLLRLVAKVLPFSTPPPLLGLTQPGPKPFAARCRLVRRVSRSSRGKRRGEVDLPPRLTPLVAVVWGARSPPMPWISGETQLFVVVVAFGS